MAPASGMLSGNRAGSGDGVGSFVGDCTKNDVEE